MEHHATRVLENLPKNGFNVTGFNLVFCLLTLLSLSACGDNGTGKKTTAVAAAVTPANATAPTLIVAPSSTTPVATTAPVATTPSDTATTPAAPVLPTTTSPEQNYAISQKVFNKPTVPVFYPWAGNGTDCGQSFVFNCDSANTPYSLIWTGLGTTSDVEAAPDVAAAQSELMRNDQDTLYLVEQSWHNWNSGWQYLSPDSKFYLDKSFAFSANAGFGYTKYINFTHPEWPGFLANQAVAYRNAGFDGMMFDWWHKDAATADIASVTQIENARVAIAKAIREKTGDDFILMGNVNWYTDDPTASYLSGVFFELWKYSAEQDYVLTYAEENGSAWSLERMEDLLEYWDANLRWPKILAFEPAKVTATYDLNADRNSPRNYQYAKLFTAMALVVPENGYILYADNSSDEPNSEHGHAYYDFYHTDFGKPASGMVRVSDGVAYKWFEKGLVAYNRTGAAANVTVAGKQFSIGSRAGLFLENF